MNKFPFFKSLLFAFGFIFVLSCDKDFNEVGANIIGDDNFDFDKDDISMVNCYNQFDAAIQSNNLPINMIGVNDLEGYGTTSASFVTQVELATIPTLKTIVDVQKVELTVPYYSTLVSTDADGNSTYVLDSIYGTKDANNVVTGKINLGVYESKKYLETYDQFLSLKKYYSDEASIFENNLGTTMLNDSIAASENSHFTFSAAQQTEITVAETEAGAKTTTKVAPRMKLQLNKAYFKEKLFGTSATGKLVSNTVFKEYFRGIYFKADAVSDNSAMAALNFKNGKITIHYTEKETATSTVITHKTLVLNMTGNTVNFYNNLYNGAGLPTSSIPTDATTNIYLKGGAGFHSYIDILGTANENGEVPTKDNLKNYLPEIKRIKDKNWIINEANLIFTSSSTVSFDDSPNRIYLYDAKNKRPIIDYYLDSYTNSAKPKYNKLTHGGIKYTENGLTKYKIRITNHLKNIINKDSTNVRLGLVVTEDINTVTNLFIKNAPTDKYYNRVPVSSVINPLGTILYGSNPSIEETKRVKLEIYYTKPN